MRIYKVPPVPESVWQKPTHFIAFGLGSGALPIAPGTFGTLMTIPFYLLLQNFSHSVYLIIISFITLISMWICDKVSAEIAVHDHQGMCLDEMPGYLVTMIAAPHGIVSIILGFLLFRLFDILKPFPINIIDNKMKGGIGMVLDDVLAGIYGCITLHCLFWILT